jgi:hypothetical protein
MLQSIMFKRFLIFCYFLTFCTFAENQQLLKLPISDQNFVLNGYEIQNIKSFDIILSCPYLESENFH